MKKMSSIHTDWLPLIDVSGPFLSVGVLDNVFPQGLDAVYPKDKYRLRSYWEEWNDSVDEQDVKLPAIHQEWCRSVLSDFLEMPPEVLVSGERWSVANDTGTEQYSPQLCLVDTEGKPMLFIGIYPPATNLNDMLRHEEWTASPVERMIRLCRRHSVRLGLLTNGEAWTLVNAPLDSLSGTATWYARLWFQEPKTLRAFSSLLNVSRFFGPEEETLPALLDESLNHQEEVTDTLGSQVRSAVEVLIQGLDKADERHNRELLRDVSSTELYEAGLTVMMRLVFLLSAEERGLLLDDDRYEAYYSISALREQLATEADRHGEEILERRYDAWARLLALFRAVYAGIEHPELRLPALGGSIFNPDHYPFLEGRAKGTSWQTSNPPPLPIDNRTVLLLLNSLQLLEQANGALRLSYRSLDVESIGHIYEGLLEHTAKKAPEIMLGLIGTKDFPLPNISLPEVESLALLDKKKLYERLKDVTKRNDAAFFKNRYNKPLSPELLERLATICGGDDALLERIKPFGNWLRTDAWEMPLIYPKGAFMVTAGQDRRDTGTHYTPKTLTVKIVERTLEPLVYEGPAEGTPKEQWKMKTPAELLSLKICDPAMGSGAFLVQSCRYLGECLVDAWEQAEKQGKFVTSSGEVHDSADAEPMNALPEERLNEARRLVAEKCLYGVDINPLAVDLAKLSLWLITISKGRPFAFLDHNFKSGDSLLGMTDLEQLRKFSLEPKTVADFFYGGKQFSERINDIMEMRREISSIIIHDITDVQKMEERNKLVNQKLDRLKLLADLFVSTLLTFKGDMSKPKDKQKIANGLESLSAYANDILNEPEEKIQFWRKKAREQLDDDLPYGKSSRVSFHWALEFPEVFAQGGFDAVVGNPPFSGGQHLTGTLGTAYRNYLVNFIAGGMKGSADLCAYFYLRAFSILNAGGVFGLIACNTIAEGDTRQVGLERMVQQGGSIIAANPNMPWPGTAAVVISLVFFRKDCTRNHVHRLENANGLEIQSIQQDGHWHGLVYFNDEPTETISPFLSQQEEWSPKVLKENEGQSFIGSYVLGMGFTMSAEEAKAFIAKDPKNAEVLFPYLNGDDLNSSPEQKASRWVINFFDWPLDRDADGSWEHADDKKRKAFLSSLHVPIDYPGRVASDFPEILDIVIEKVKPERDKLSGNQTNEGRKKRWFHYGRDAKALYHAIGRGAVFAQHPKEWKEDDTYYENIIAITRVSKHLVCSFVSKNVYSEMLVVISSSSFLRFAVIASCFHEAWIRKNSSTLGLGIRYTPSDCYETFPFPKLEHLENLESLGRKYDETRHAIMLSDNVGLTRLYNAFHNPENHDSRYEELRRHQCEIDIAVRDAYGWSDIVLDHGFHAVGYLPENDNIRYTISESARIEILKRLAKLNHERWEKEL
ncbi:MAG: hypothetical protein K5787_15045 [Lentisphaeria bacterium]|nr:hypothetical protein [Lentisphaeria bacterium]